MIDKVKGPNKNGNFRRKKFIFYYVFIIDEHAYFLILLYFAVFDAEF